VKKFRFLVFKCVANELERPSQNEKHQRVEPQPMNEDATDKQRDRNQDRRNSQGMAHPVYGMLMAARILCNPLFVSTPAKHGGLMIHGTIRTCRVERPSGPVVASLVLERLVDVGL
jgi:hypothetical protein